MRRLLWRLFGPAAVYTVSTYCGAERGEVRRYFTKRSALNYAHGQPYPAIVVQRHEDGSLSVVEAMA